MIELRKAHTLTYQTWECVLKKRFIISQHLLAQRFLQQVQILLVQ
jgi:hypothetical protein